MIQPGSRGQSGFGTAGHARARWSAPTWQTDDIWLRREMTCRRKITTELQAWLHHDEDAEVYINGVLALKAGGFITSYDAFPLTPQGKPRSSPAKI